MELGLGPGDFVLGGDPAPPPQKGVDPQIFGPCLLCQNGWMDQDGSFYIYDRPLTDTNVIAMSVRWIWW